MCFFASLAAHETGHVLVGKRYGWEYKGILWRKLLIGAGVMLGHKSTNMKEWRLGLVAVAGPCATLLCCILFIGLSQLPIEYNFVFGQMALLNFALFIFNLLPLPMTDGGHILFAITGWRVKWRYVGVAWIALEVLLLILIILL